MKRVLFIITALLISASMQATKNLSTEAYISLLTCSPGKGELYTIYGHSALRVKDTANNIDVVFNYGTFDFNTPNFYLKFANGNLNYFLSYRSFKGFVQSYFNNNQSLWEQELNLTHEEKQNLFNALLTNTQPENKYYRYDFFFDNCATRIRDIVFENIDHQIAYRDTSETIRSFRSYIHEYEAETPWVLQGLDILLGLKTDDPAYVHDQMFMPDYLMLYFAKAQKSESINQATLVKEMKPILKFDQEDEENNHLSPTYAFWALFIFGIFVMIYEVNKRKKPVFLYNRFIFFITGLVALLICFLWFISKHEVTGDNYNLMWALPSYILLALLPIKAHKNIVIKTIIVLSVISSLAFVLGWFIIPQHLPPMVFPIVLLLLIRLIGLYHYLYRKA